MDLRRRQQHHQTLCFAYLQALRRNMPGGRWGGATWKDASGKLWLFGGNGVDAIGGTGSLNDLWEYDITNNVWKWVKGSNNTLQVGTYGTQGAAANANTPGARYSAVAFTDATGNLWLFGGLGYAAIASNGHLNDLWRYNTSSNQWTWMKGSNVVSQTGVYGTQGTAAPANNPGGRINAYGWTDNTGNLWVSGGSGFATSGPADILNDLWRYDMTSNEWTWIKGNNTTSTPQGIYGTQGSFAPTNLPGARYGAITWTDGAGDLWLFSGYGFDTGTVPDFLNDLWRYDIAGNQWKWVRGATAVNQPGIYGIQGQVSPLNMPGSRGYAANWKDGSNNLWLFGGRGYGTGSNPGDLNDLWKFFNCLGPNITITATSNTVCAGVSATLTASGADTYTWTGQQSTPTVVVAPLGTSDYTVTATDINECKNSATFTLHILPLPAVGALYSDSVICAGETTTLISTGAATYTWSTGDVGTTTTISPQATASYTVRGTANNGCIDSAMVTQYVNSCTGIEKHQGNTVQVSAFPNPNQGVFTIGLSNQQPGRLCIINALGQVVMQENLNAEETSIRTHLPAGIYQYRVTQQKQTVATGKLLIE